MTEAETTYGDRIQAHYESVWGQRAAVCRLTAGPVEELPADFCVLRFAPGATREMWVYATRCMSQPGDACRTEVHLFSPDGDDAHVELLTALAHYRRTAAALDVGHTVWFGRPWKAGSQCEYGLLSRPYLDGPRLEYLELVPADRVRFLWLIPMTLAEREYKMRHGLEALEGAFEKAGFNYLDPHRSSVV